MAVQPTHCLLENYMLLYLARTEPNFTLSLCFMYICSSIVVYTVMLAQFRLFTQSRRGLVDSVKVSVVCILTRAVERR